MSETFIAQEILGLQQRGLPLSIVSLRHPYDGAVHSMHRAITAPVLYLPEYLKDDPQRVARARKVVEQLPGYERAHAAFRADLERDRSASRRRRFGQAAVLAAELPASVSLIYVHYLHTPSSVARYASLMTGVPYAFSAHAKDIYTTPDWELSEKIDGAAWGVTCTQANCAHLSRLSADPGKVSLVYHGLDFSRFPAPAEAGTAAAGTLRILSVCRAVEKKGLDDLLRALAKLPARIDWRFEHVGGGSGIAKLTALAARLGIAKRVAFLGAKPQDDVIEAYRRADVFVLASRVAKNGDRDGLPNVIMEAMALGLPVVSTAVSAIPEIVVDETGILVPPRDPAALASAIAELADAPARRKALGRAGAERVRTSFASDPGIDRIAEMMRVTVGERQAA